MRPYSQSLLVIVASLLCGYSAFAEVTDGTGHRGHRHFPFSGLFSGADLKKIQPELRKIQSFMKDNVNRVQRTEKYAMLKKYNCDTGYFDTYLVNLKGNMGRPKIVEKFSTAVGYAGVGCGAGQTRPGIYKLRAWRSPQKPDRGASRKASWGNDYKMFYQDPVDGRRSCICTQCVFHSRKSMSEPARTLKGSKRNGRAVTRSAGCTTVAESVFDKFDTYGEFNDVPGNTLVMNPTVKEYKEAVSRCAGNL